MRSFVVVVVVAFVCVSACVPAVDPDAVPSSVADLRINEVAAAGVPADWFELVTVGDEVALDDVSFSDDAAAPDKGSFPEGATVSPGEFVVVQVDDAGVGFKLGSDEELHLFARENGAVIDAVDWAEGDSPAGGSWARVSDGDGDFEKALADTEGRSNAG